MLPSVERRLGLPLVVLHPVGRSEDDLVVPPLGLQMRNEPENRFGLHHHTGLPAEGIIVHMAVFVGRPVPDVVYHDFHQPRPLRPLEDRLVKRGDKQFGNDGQYVYAHSFDSFGPAAASAAEQENRKGTFSSETEQDNGLLRPDVAPPSPR